MKLCISIEWHTESKREKFLAALERFEDRCHALDSIWFVSTPWTAEQVYTYLGQYLHPHDILLVEAMAVGEGWWAWVRPDVCDWLKKHIGPAGDAATAAQ